MASHNRPLILLALAAVLSACGSGSTPPAPPAQSDVAALQSIDLKVGDGPAVAAGQLARVNYTGWLYEAGAKDHKGKEFDSSLKRGPFEFPVGGQQVIKGWDQGVVGMKVGGSRRLIIPSDLGYGDAGAPGGVIPPGATLVFDIDLVSIGQ